MEKVNNVEDFSKLLDNNILYQDDIQIEKSEISFVGKNNFLVVEKGALIINSRIRFKGNNSIVYIKKLEITKLTCLSIFTMILYFL